MKEKRVNRFLISIASALFLLSSSSILFSASLSRQTLQSDLSYYRQTAKAKSLDTNDRLYILTRIEEKYKGSGVDLKPLKTEIGKLKKPAKPVSPKKTAVRKAKPAVSSESEEEAAPGWSNPLGIVKK